MTLTPTNTNEDGAILTVLDSDVTPTPTQWNIYVTSQIGFHFKISLDNSWGFHSQFISTIKFTIDGTTPLPLQGPDKNAVLSFSINDNEYITHIAMLDNDQTNALYPGIKCINPIY